MDYSEMIRTITVFALPMLLAITLHEVAHGYVARILGDNTAYMMGRLSLNPLKHIDFWGTIVMPLLLYLASSGAFMFGYAKPVPVNFSRLNRPRRDMILVALAGPLSNVVQALIWGVIVILLSYLHINEMFFYEMASAGLTVNIIFAAFNLLPLPPLDGGRIVTGLLPPSIAYKYAQIERYGFMILLAIILLGSATRFSFLYQFWIQPVYKGIFAVIELILSPLMHLL